jgi:putative flippase GtrA
VTGGLAAAVNFGSRIVYNQWVNFSIAVVLAYLTGMVTAFALARYFVFTESNQSMQRSALWFVVVNIVAVIQTWVISMLLAYYLLPRMGFTQFISEIAHAVGVVVPVFTSYLGHKRFSFK